MSAAGDGQGEIAVIIPVRNGEAYLGKAIDSIVGQVDVQLGEIIVVDDGSSDRSAAVAEARAGVRCLRQPPLGLADALNRGIEATAKPFVAFLDCDDVMTPKSLCTRHAALAADKTCDAVVGRMIEFIDPDAPAEVRTRYRADPNPALAYVAGTTLCRRDAIMRAGPFDPALGPTTYMDWMLRARHGGMKFLEIDTVVLERRIHGGNMTVNRAAIEASYLKVVRRHLARQRNSEPQKS